MLQEDNNLESITRVIFAMVISSVLIIGWQFFFDNKKKNIKQAAETKTDLNEKIHSEIESDQNKDESSTQRSDLGFKNDTISGLINLMGLKIDRANLFDYKKDIDNEEKISLLNPKGSGNDFFISFGWSIDDSEAENQTIGLLPGPKSLWLTEAKELTPTSPAILKWDNKSGTVFFVKLSMSDDYLINFDQWIETKDTKSEGVKIVPYVRIKKIIDKKNDSSSYEGPIGIVDGKLNEISYKKVTKQKYISNQNNISSCKNNEMHWNGISQKYWLSSLIYPCKNVTNSTISFHSEKNDLNYAQYITNFNSVELKSHSKVDIASGKLFIGAKNISVLDTISKKYNTKLFDKSIDFGMFYFLTKPILISIKLINKVAKNYGLSIIILTILIRILMLPLGNKSYRAMNKMKFIQPKMEEIKAKYPNDKAEMSKAMMNLYKQEGVNPLSSIFPILIQIPIFIALYKVLYVSIELRQSPFIFWIKDLSVADPTSIFNLFGLIPIKTSGIFQLGVLPLLVSFTMWIQQKMSMSSMPDSDHAKIMKYMPIFFAFIFSGMPSGLMIYWTVSNVFSIVNQYIVQK